MIDDSALFHGTYDPVKAREYYLRTRKLKGRTKASAPALSPRPRAAIAAPKAVKAVGGKPNRANTKSRRAELEAQKKALEKRLEHLRDILKKLVAEAKKTAHKNAAKKPKEGEKGRASETQSDKADRNDHEKSRKPLTAAQKHKKAQAAKKAYEKEHPNSLSQDVDVLREQVKDIQAKIQKALADAAERKKKAQQAQRRTNDRRLATRKETAQNGS